jgi:hypothetical protein
VPFDTAFDMVDACPEEAIAHLVIIGELNGKQFDWIRLDWVEKN